MGCSDSREAQDGGPSAGKDASSANNKPPAKRRLSPAEDRTAANPDAAQVNGGGGGGGGGGLQAPANNKPRLLSPRHVAGPSTPLSNGVGDSPKLKKTTSGVAPMLRRLSSNDSVLPTGLQARTETRAGAQPHYALDELMEDGQHLALFKQRQGHIGAAMLCSPVHTYNVGFFGPSEAGKTHLLYTLIYGPHYAEPAATDETRAEILYVSKGLDEPRANFKVVDTAGDATVGHVAEEMRTHGLQGMALVVALGSGASDIAVARRMLEEAAAAEQPFPILLLGTKSDARDAGTLQNLEAKLGLPEAARGHPYTSATSSVHSEAGHSSAAKGLFGLYELLASQSGIHPSVASPRRKPSKRLIRNETGIPYGRPEYLQP
eukprot:Rhum_TRINITY_DN14439_c20_g1::Rhum_TRINITY_DN14439_c20_g1_i1::g.92147::m.92147